MWWVRNPRVVKVSKESGTKVMIPLIWHLIITKNTVNCKSSEYPDIGRCAICFLTNLESALLFFFLGGGGGVQTCLFCTVSNLVLKLCSNPLPTAIVMKLIFYLKKYITL